MDFLDAIGGEKQEKYVGHLYQLNTMNPSSNVRLAA